MKILIPLGDDRQNQGWLKPKDIDLTELKPLPKGFKKGWVTINGNHIYFAEPGEGGGGKSGTSNGNAIENKMVDRYGTTDNPKDAAFMTADGKMIPFGGLNEDDHSAMVATALQIPLGPLNEEGNYNNPLYGYLIDSNNVRLQQGESNVYLMMGSKPSDSQMSALKDFTGGREVSFDFVANTKGDIAQTGHVGDFKDFKAVVDNRDFSYNPFERNTDKERLTSLIDWDKLAKEHRKKK